MRTVRLYTTAAQSLHPDHSELDNMDSVNSLFARTKIGSFFQAQPHLGNQFTEDITLQKYLRRHLPHQVKSCMNK